MRSNPCGSPRPASGPSSFVLYVEGPSDCDILRTWARLVSPPLSRELARSAVILGGRRPARAVDHFRSLASDSAAGNAKARGLCVLDRDDHSAHSADDAPEGLEFFTWPRRHIESYLLVPTAIRRCMRMAAGDPRLAGVLGDLPGSGCEDRLRELDAKRLLAGKSALARELGSPLSAARIARCMRRSDLHEDILHLLGRLEVTAEVRASSR